MAISTDSRFKNSIRNTFFALLAQIVNVFCKFYERQIFIETLGVEYLGLSTAFTGILAVISFAELGIGSAIIYSLYKPIAENDTEKINSLMSIFKKSYYIIGTLVLLIGSGITPYLSFFIKDIPDIADIEYIYLLIVLYSGLEYFFSYNISFLSAIQRGDITFKVEIIYSLIKIISQVSVLIFFKNYFLYMFITILSTLIKYCYIYMYIYRTYPFFREKPKKLARIDLAALKKYIFSIFIYKIGKTISATIDTILISKFLGVIEVALYSNYNIIISYSNTFFISILGAVCPSVGNFMAQCNTQKKEHLFSILQMIYYWISTYFAVGLYVLLNPLIELWLGKDYLLSQTIVLALVISLTITNFQRPCSLIRDTCGLFQYGRLRPLAMGVINLSISLYLIPKIGILGVLIGTILSKLITFAWYDPYIAYKYVLGKGLSKYFIKYFKHWIILIILLYICNYIHIITPFTGLFKFILGIVNITIVVNFTFFILYFKTNEWQYISSQFKNLLSKRR